MRRPLICRSYTYIASSDDPPDGLRPGPGGMRDYSMCVSMSDGTTDKLRYAKGRSRPVPAEEDRLVVSPSLFLCPDRVLRGPGTCRSDFDLECLRFVGAVDSFLVEKQDP